MQRTIRARLSAAIRLLPQVQRRRLRAAGFAQCRGCGRWVFDTHVAWADHDEREQGLYNLRSGGVTDVADAGKADAAA